MNTTLFLSHRNVLATILCVLFPYLVSAQSPGQSTLSGKVLDSTTNEAMSSVTVRLLKKEDGKLVKGTTTDLNGSFAMTSLSAGDYRLLISFVGYHGIESEISLSKSKKVDLGTLKMSPSATVLKGVDVTGQLRPVVLKQDTVEFNAGAFKVKSGANVEELLKKLPGIEVDSEGNITYNGERIEKVEVDGRNFFSKDPKMTTRNLPSLMIDKVQVVDKQSDESILTGMDDGTRTKVLNLRIKPDMKRGVISNLNAAYGTQNRYAGDLMINYFDKDARYSLLGNFNNTEGVLAGEGDRDTRRIGFNYETSVDKKFDMTSEITYEGEDNNKSGKVVRENLLGQNKRNIYREDYTDRRRKDEVSGLARMEWKPDSLTTVFFTPGLSWTRSFTESMQSYQTYDQDDELINKGVSKRTQDNTSVSGDAEIHFSRRLSPSGRHLYLGLEGHVSQSDGLGSNLVYTDFLREGNADENIDQKQESGTKSGKLMFRSSYIEPVGGLWAFQLNYRLDAQYRKNRREAYNKDIEGGYTIPDEVYTRGATSTFQNHSLGVNLRYKVDRSHVTFGIDARPSHANSISTIGSKEVFSKSRVVWNYAPSVRIEYRRSDSITFNLRYNGRTAHASMEQLNPAVMINSPLSKVIGNPDLLPSFSHTLRFMGNYNSPTRKQSFGIMGRATLTDNAIVDRRSVDPKTGAVQTTYENVSGVASVGLGFMASVPLWQSGWSFFLVGRVGYERTKAYINNELNAAQIFTPSFSPRFTWRGDNLSFSLGARGQLQQVSNAVATNLDRKVSDYSLINEINWSLPWSIELMSSIVYTQKRGYSQELDANLCLWDLSVGKSFLKNNAATIEVSVFDILGQRNSFSRNISSSAITDRTVNNISTYAIMTFKYKLNTLGKERAAAANDGRSRRGYDRYRRGHPAQPGAIR